MLGKVTHYTGCISAITKSTQLCACIPLSHYLRVSDTDDTFYEAILFCGLEDRHTVLSILLHSLGATIRPVLVAHLL